MDPRRVNGGTFLGLNGIAVKSHGGTDAWDLRAPSISATRWRKVACVERLATDLTAFHAGSELTQARGIEPARTRLSSCGRPSRAAKRAQNMKGET